MLLGIKRKKELLERHLLISFLALFIVVLFWVSRPELSFNVRLWRALGDTSFSFLFVTLAIGPLARLWKPMIRLVSWRRETGIWFSILAFSHFLSLSSFALSEQGIELPRFLGLTALFWALVLSATSSDRAVNFLGTSSWKWLHTMAYVIFYLVVGHAAYFLFWRYPVANWFQYPFLIFALIIPVLQFAAFIKEIVRQKGNIFVRVDNRIQKIRLPILGQRIIAEKTCEISFDLSEREFKFLPGQYIRVSVPKLLYSDTKGRSRLFSIASSPNDKNKLNIAFRDTGSGFKRTLMELPVGSLVDIEGPFGFFTLPKDDSRLLVFIAGGIGITPFLSMIRYATEQKLKYRIVLFYANRNAESAAYLEELKIVARKNPSFSFQNKFGRIDANFIRKHVKNLNKAVWYIVGPPSMVYDTRDLLSHLNINETDIYFEDFIGY